MKSFVVAAIISCLVAGVAQAQEESTNWEVEWTDEPAYNTSLIEPFEVPGFILPDLNVSDILQTIGMMYQAEDVVHAIGSFCVQMGPKLNWVTDGVMQELCDPILEALRNQSYAEAYSICKSSWSTIESLVELLFGEDEMDGENEGPYEGEYNGETEGEMGGDTEGERPMGSEGEGILSRLKRWGFSPPSIDLGSLPDIPDLPDVAIPNITIPFDPIIDLNFNWTYPVINDTADIIGNIGLILEWNGTLNRYPNLDRNWSYPQFDGGDLGFDFPFFDFPNEYEICAGLAGLIVNQGPSPSSVFGTVLKVTVAEYIKSIAEQCFSLVDDGEEEGSGDMGGEPLFESPPDMMTEAFAILGGFDDLDQICNVSSWAILMRDRGHYELFNEVVNQITSSMYTVITNRSRCVDFADTFYAHSGRNYSSILSSEDFCDRVMNATDWRGNVNDISLYRDEYMDGEEMLINLLWVAEVLSTQSDMASIEFLCKMSDYTDDRFCDSLLYNDYREYSKEQIIEQCLRYVSFGRFDFDWYDVIDLLTSIGDEFDFNFYDPRQTCHHFSDIIFNDFIKHEYTISNVVLKAMKVAGRILAPKYCDLQSFSNMSWPELPCETPGRDCFNWTMRNDEYYSDRLDVGFIVGTIFSYLGGYMDGDHICHEMAFALDNDTRLDMVAGHLRDSFFRLFSDAPFCSDTIGIIMNLMGLDTDIVQMIGFNSTDAFCGQISMIYTEGGSYNTSFEPLLDLFMEESVKPETVMHVGVEMIKIVSMVMNSNDIGDALTLSCHAWLETVPHYVDEVDDLCRFVLELEPEERESFCIANLIPFLHGLLFPGDKPDDKDDEEKYDLDEFDFEGLFDTLGEEFGFNLEDTHQSCSHLTNILFNQNVSQHFPIQSVIMRAVTALGRTLPPFFCDLEEFRNTSLLEVETPCATPGENCFNWSSRGEEFFYDRDDIGFIVGTVFSYLGGYRDGDHLCHQMSFALEDETLLNMVSTRITDSVIQIFNDHTSCSGILDIINNLIGEDEDIAFELGFNSTNEFCTQIINEDGDSQVSLDPLLELFDSESDDDLGIRNATLEIIELAAMIMHSENLGDAISKTCYLWLDSASNFNDSEIDHFCQMVIDQNATALYQVCTGEFLQVIEDNKDEGRNRTVIDLSEIEICLDNGDVTFEDFEDLDIFVYLEQTVNKLYNLTEFDEDGVCRAVTNVVNSRKNIRTLISDFAVEWITLFMPVGAEICSCWDAVFHSLFNGSEDSDFGVAQFNEIVLIAVNSIGLDDHHSLCDDLTHIQPNNISEYAHDIMDEIFSFVEDPAKCACTAHRVLNFILPLVNLTMEEFNNYLTQYVGFPSVDHICTFVASSFSGVEVDPETIFCDAEQVPTTDSSTTAKSSTATEGTTTAAATEEAQEPCLLIRDCFGVCGGSAVRDCTQTCNGTAVLDCAFQCNGEATVNECNECVGGRTGRPSNFGIDECGNCEGTGSSNVDCNGDCNGTAVRDACQLCVGGNTGLDVNVNERFLDCRGVCNGTFVNNDCDECVLPFSDGTVFSTQDCNGDCNGFAVINQCNFCTGGNSGNNADAGFSECGVCNTTEFADFCLGCDGVANSGATTDACGVCGGDGSTCFTVDNIVPDTIPANSDYQVRLRGAGFQGATTKQCKFLDGNGEQIGVVDISNEVGDEFNCTANLPEGIYSVYLSTETTELSEESVTLYVYSEIAVNSISETEIDIDTSMSTISVTMTSSNGAFSAYTSVSTPRAIVITESERLVIEGTFDGENDELLQFEGPMLTTSAQVVVYPSLNGIDYLGTPDDAGFTITYYAPAPVAQYLKFSPTGHLLQLEFDVRINVEAVTSCDAVFTNTTSLGDYALCFSSSSLKGVNVIPFGLDTSSLIATGDTLDLQADVIQKGNEAYARFASGTVTATAPDEEINVVAILTGTESLSSCANVFLNALQSYGNAGRDFNYEWSVTSTGSIPTGLTDDLSAAADSPFVALAGSYLDADTAYTFSVTVENFFGGSGTQTLEVTRSALNRPDVVVYPLFVDTSAARISEPFYLSSKVTFYDACGGAAQMEYSWSVDDNSIALDLLTINKPILYVPAGSLPGNSELTFTLAVNRASDPDTVTSQSVTITTVFTDLVARIDGGKERTIGVDSGSFMLDGSSSYDPDNQNEEISYLWTCQRWLAESSSYEPCVSSETREVFPAEADSKASTLTLGANNLYADSTYEFTLEITKVSRTASTSVFIHAEAGNPPTINFGVPIPDKIRSTIAHTLQVFITHTSAITIEWATVDTDLGNGYVDFSQFRIQQYSIDNTSTVAVVTVPAGTLEEGVTYSFSVTVTDSQQQVSTSKVTTSTYGGVSSCTFSAEGGTTYQELDEITLIGKNCVTDEDALPLSYKVFHERTGSDGSRYYALTVAQPDSQLTITGQPATANNQSNYVIEVCNYFDSCSTYTVVLDVTAITEFSQEQFDEAFTNLVEPQKLSGDYTNALINLNTIAEVSTGTSSSRRRRAVSETSTTAAEQLELLQSAISSTVLDTSTAQTLLDQSASVIVAELTLADMDGYLDVLIELVAVFLDEALSASSTRTVLEKTEEIGAELSPEHNSDILDKIATLRNSLVQGQFSEIPLGGDPTETLSGTQSIRALYVIPTDTISTSSQNTSFNVNFGSEIEGSYGASWTCATGTCSGVRIRFTQYTEDVDYYSTNADDIANRAASILEIDLLDPSDNSELTISGLSTPVSINMTATLLQTDKVYDCFYWDTTTSTWSQDGLTTIYHTSVLSECQATHLTAFTLIAVDAPTTLEATTMQDGVTTTEDGAVETTTEISESGPGGLNTGGIIGIAVVVPIVVILIIIIAVVVVMKSKKTSKVDNADVENTNQTAVSGNANSNGGGGGMAPVESTHQAFGTPTHHRNPPPASQAPEPHIQTVQTAAEVAAPEPEQEPIRDPLDLPGSPSPPPEGPHIETIIRDSNGDRAPTPDERAKTPVERAKSPQERARTPVDRSMTPVE